MIEEDRSRGPGARRRWSHLLWLGPLITFAGAISYFTLFARYPALRDFPWVNLPVVLAGLLISLVGVRRAFARPRTIGRCVAASVVLLFSCGLAALFNLYVFRLSYLLPDPAPATIALATAPDFALSDAQGRTVRLSDLRGGKVVLTFYRGYW